MPVLHARCCQLPLRPPDNPLGHTFHIARRRPVIDVFSRGGILTPIQTAGSSGGREVSPAHDLFRSNLPPNIKRSVRFQANKRVVCASKEPLVVGSLVPVSIQLRVGPA